MRSTSRVIDEPDGRWFEVPGDHESVSSSSPGATHDSAVHHGVGFACHRIAQVSGSDVVVLRTDQFAICKAQLGLWRDRQTGEDPAVRGGAVW